ncbi:MAG: LOG family protein [Bdellovibrionota bacterium]
MNHQKKKKIQFPYNRRKRPIKAYKDPDFINSVDARPLRILAEYMEPMKRLKELNVENTIVFFGSARLLSSTDAKKSMTKARDAKSLEKAKAMVHMSQYYDDAVELARLLTVWSKKNFGKSENRFIICSGGGPGIMEAANRGAKKAKGESIGLNISLPFEANSNPYITPELNFEFHYFFTRKYWFSYLAKALVIFPGGFGTLDELAEVLTLIQTQKIKRKIPILIYGSKFWNKVINLEEMAKMGTIDKKDLDLLHFSDTPKDAFEFIVKGIRKYYVQQKSFRRYK